MVKVLLKYQRTRALLSQPVRRQSTTCTALSAGLGRDPVSHDEKPTLPVAEGIEVRLATAEGQLRQVAEAQNDADGQLTTTDLSRRGDRSSW